MISLIEKTIKEKLPKDICGLGCELSFLKYSTPASGKKINDKVIFLVFKIKEREPFLCVKTVRSYDAKDRIIKNFNNLKNTNILTDNGIYANLFAQALYLYDDGENIFSIESACKGKRVSKRKSEIDDFVKQYTNFQQSIYKGEVYKIGKEYFESLISQLGLDKDSKDTLNRYFDKITNGKDVKLAKIHQHGDLTLDNVFIDSRDIRIIDCDIFGEINLAGYDLYKFFSRLDKDSLKLNLNNYFNTIGTDMTATNGLLFIYYIQELLFKKDYILKDKTSEDIINNFENK